MCIIHQYPAVHCVVPRIRRLNLSSTIQLAWTFGHITNLMMKTESDSGASVDLKEKYVAVTAG